MCFGIMDSSCTQFITRFNSVYFYQIFVGNDDSKTIAVRHLKHPITARYLRIHPLAWYGVHICMRAELYGCDHLG